MLIDLDAKRHLQVEETKKLLYEEKVYSRGATTGCLTERAAQHAEIDKVHLLHLDSPRTLCTPLAARGTHQTPRLVRLRPDKQAPAAVLPQVARNRQFPATAQLSSL